MKAFCIMNFKGGVGKTTSTINIGYYLALQGYKVCFVDLDPQANLTINLGLGCIEALSSMYGYMLRDSRFDSILVKISENISILPSHFSLIKIEMELASAFEREHILEKKLASLETSFDFMIMDCPPNFGVMTINGLLASDFIFVPIEPEFFALQGFSILTEAIDNIGMAIDGLFVTKYDKRRILNRHVLESLEKSFQDKLFKTKIRENISLAEAQIRGMDIFSYNNKSHGAQDYACLSEEILNFLKKVKNV